MKKLSLLVLFSVLCCFVANAQTNSYVVFQTHYVKDIPLISQPYAKFKTPTYARGVRFTVERKGKCTFQGSYVTTCGHLSYDLAPVTLNNSRSSDVSTYEFRFNALQLGEEYNWDINITPVSEQELPAWGGGPSDGMGVKIEYFWY